MSARPGFLIATASMLLLVGCKQDPGQRGQQSTGIAEGNRTARLPVQSDRYVLPPSKSPAAPASGAFAIAFKDEIWGEQKYLVGSASDPLPGKSIRATDLARTIDLFHGSTSELEPAPSGAGSGLGVKMASGSYDSKVGAKQSTRVIKRPRRIPTPGPHAPLMLLDGQLSADVVHLTLMSLCHHGGRLGVDAGGIAAAHAVTLTAVPVLYRCPTHVRYDVPWKSPRICVDANQVSFLPSAEGEPEDVISVPVDQSDAPKLVAALSSLRRADPETPLFIQAREWDTQAWHLARVLDLAAAAGYRYAVLETPEECDGRKSIAEPTKKSDDPRGHVTVLGADGLLAPDLAKHFASRLDDLAQCYRQRLRWDPDYAADFDVSVNPGQPSGTQVRLERPVPQRLHQCFESALGNYSFPQELRDRYPSFTVRLAKTADK